MSKRSPYAQQVNSFNRQAGKSRNYNGQQQGRPVSAPEKPSNLSLEDRLNAPLSASYVGKSKPSHKNNTSHSGVGRHKDRSSSHNDQYNNLRELNSNRMESNPARSSAPSRVKGRGGRGGGSGGGRGRGNGETRGGRGGYQGRGDDGRGRNDTWNGSAATPPAAGNDTDEEFEDNVRDLTSVMPASRMAKFSNTSLEQASYEELKIARDQERKDAIANGTIDDPEKRKTLEHAIDFVGTCMDMCPLFERQQRAVQNAVDRWEINPATGKIDKALAVKQFHRPAAGNDAQLPSDVRPPQILVSTLDYLINVIAGGSEPLEQTHPFLRDRTRGIRQDFTLQNYRGSETVGCHELIARFHILSIHKLCEDTKNFVAQQEMEQLQKVLTSLSELYEDARLVNIIYPNEPEFRAYQIIAHLRDPDQERQAQRWPEHIFNSKPVQQALRFFALAQRNNDEAVHMRAGNAESCSNFFGTIFRLIKSKNTPYLMACLLETHFNEIRKTALKAIKNTYRPNTKQLLLKDIKEMLAYENEEMALRDCEHYGMALGEVEVEGRMVWHLVIQKGGANWNESLPALKQSFHTELVESKIGRRTIPDVIYGRKATGPKKLNPTVVPFVLGSIVFGNTPIAALQTAPSTPPVTNQQSPFGKPPTPALHNPIVTPVFGPAAHQPFPTGQPPPTSLKPVAGIFLDALQAPNAFRKVSNASAQSANVFQKASNMPMQSVFKPQVVSGSSTAGIPSWGTLQKVQDPRLAGAPTSSPVSVFTPAAQTLKTVSTSAPISAFAPATGNPTPRDIFKSGYNTAPVNKLPSGIFTTPATAPSLPSNASSAGSVFRSGSATGIPQSSSPEVALERFFQPPTSSKTPPQLVSQLGPAKALPTGLFQPQASSQSLFQGTPKVVSDGLFQQAQASPGDHFQPSSPPTTSTSSLFKSQPSSIAASTTGTTNGGSVFDSHPGQKSFPSNFFSAPVLNTSNDDFSEWDNKNTILAPVQTGSGDSLFDRNNPLNHDTSTKPTNKPLGSLNFVPAASFAHSSSITSSLMVPDSFTSDASLVAPAQPTTQLDQVEKPLLSRSTAWELSNFLLEEFLTKEVKKTVQSAVDEDKAKVVDTVAAEKYEEAQKLVARKIALDVAAEQFYAIRSGARVFYTWKAKARKLMMKRKGDERRSKPLTSQPIQWRPVRIPEAVFDGPIKEVHRMTNLTYQTVPLLEIFHPEVEQAFRLRNEGGRRWRLLLKSNNITQDINNYWWIEKFIGNGQPRVAESKKGIFEVQFRLGDAHTEAREIGGFVFGCSTDYSISNKERFKKDKINLHEAVNWLAGATEFKKLAIMVVCYRSPLDSDDADPYGRDIGRTSGPGRRGRIAAIRKALDLDTFDEKVIGRDIVLVENLKDCNLEPAMENFSKLVLETVNPGVAELLSRTPPPQTLAKQNSAKRKRAAQQQYMSKGSPQPAKTVINNTSTEAKTKKQRVQNVGMQTNYFSIKSRGLYVDWNKFQMPCGGTLGDGVEYPVAEEFLVTTNPIATPERRSVSPEDDSHLNGLKGELLDLEQLMKKVNGLFDNNIADLEEMKEDFKEMTGGLEGGMDSRW